MKKEANCTFKITAWDENPYKEFESGVKLTRAKVSQAYEGDLSGEGSAEFLMSHAANGTASFVGIELITGTLSGKTGSFIIQHVGTYDSNGACSTWAVLPDSGTGELIGISGQDTYAAIGETVDMPFSYEIENIATQ